MIRFFILVGLFFSIGCQNTKKESKEMTASSLDFSKTDVPILEFETKKYDFGVIEEGEVVKKAYKFKNTGGMPAMITSVEVQCGCTVAKKPMEPVPVGGISEIEVEFNSKDKIGKNHKYVTVFSTANPPEERLEFEVEVVESKK